jgi:cbb3-type cytochrome oxidase maturation protein
MSVLLLLIPVSVGLSALFVFICVKAIRAGQFDDMQSPAWRVLFDPPQPPSSETRKAP